MDEEWFAARGEGRCPTVGEPKTFIVDDGSLVGRRSKSRNIIPDVDCSSDGAVSARQAVLGHHGTLVDGHRPGVDQRHVRRPRR